MFGHIQRENQRVAMRHTDFLICMKTVIHALGFYVQKLASVLFDSNIAPQCLPPFDKGDPQGSALRVHILKGSLKND